MAPNIRSRRNDKTNVVDEGYGGKELVMIKGNREVLMNQMEKEEAHEGEVERCEEGRWL